MSRFTVQPGDRVAHSAQFLRSIGCLTGDLPAARGVVRAVLQLGENQLAVVDWDRPGIPQRILARNLARIGANRRFANCD